MTEMECKQACSRMSAEQLMPWLQKMEIAVNTVAPFAQHFLRAKANKDGAASSINHLKSTCKAKTIAIILFAAAAILFFVLSAGAGMFAGLICKLLAFFFLICFVVGFFTALPDMTELKKTKKRLPELEAEFEKAQALLETAKTQHNDWLVIRQWICPQECSSPAHMRMFVSYFEDGRASNLKEARNLFDQYMHRLRMEEAAQAQVAASQAAANAAYDAMVAANNAASAAQQAKNSSDRAAFNAQNKF